MLPLKPKQPCALNLSANLAAYITSAYQKDPKEYMSELKALEQIREGALLFQVSPVYAEKLIRYICELQLLPSRFPVDEDNIKLAIGWYNFVSTTANNKPISLFSLLYEQAACMFNLGIVYGRLGQDTIKVDPKKACSLFMQSAGVFEWIMQLHADNRLRLPLNSDLSLPVITGLKDAMLGRSQECCLLKGISDKNSDGLLAKVAMGAANYYAASAAAFAESPVMTTGDGKILIAAVQTLFFVNKIFAEQRKASEAGAEGRYGEEVGRLQILQSVVPHMNELMERIPSDLLAYAKSTLNSYTLHLNHAKKDNDLIYHEAVPSNYPLIQTAVLVKPTPFTAINTFTSGLFDSLIPHQLHQTMLRYQRLRDERVSCIDSEFEQLLSSLSETLSKYGLPGKVEAIEEPIGVPSNLQSKCAELMSLGGMSSLTASIELVESLSKECCELFSKIDSLLVKEERDDANTRIHGVTGSREAGRTYYEKMEQIKDALSSAKEADLLIESRIQRYGKDLNVLCAKNPDTLQMAIPASHPSTRLTPAARMTIERVKLVLSEVSCLRDAILNEKTNLHSLSHSDYPKEQLMGSNVDFKIDSELSKYPKIFQPCLFGFKQQILKLSDSLKLAMEEMERSTKGTGSDSTERQLVLARLDDAYKHYLVINRDVAEGIKFYSGLEDPLGRLYGDCRDFVTVREMERSEHLNLPGNSHQPAHKLSPNHTQHSTPAAGSNQPQKKWMPGMPINYADNSKYK